MIMHKKNTTDTSTQICPNETHHHVEMQENKSN